MLRRRGHSRLRGPVHRSVRVVVVAEDVKDGQRRRRGERGRGRRRRRRAAAARGGWGLADDENSLPVPDVMWHDVQLVPRRPPGAWPTHSTRCSSSTDSTFRSLALFLSLLALSVTTPCFSCGTLSPLSALRYLLAPASSARGCLLLHLLLLATGCLPTPENLPL